MSPRTEEQFAEIRDTRRFQIMEAALQVFADEGYHTASMAKIAKQANISKGLIYNYFESKEDLLRKVLLVGFEGFKESFKRMDDELDTPEELALFIDGCFDIMIKEEDFYRLYFTVLMQPAAASIIMEYYPMFIEDLVNRVAYYYEFKGDAHPKERATILMALLDGLGMQYLMAPEMFDIEIYKKVILDLFK